jgi:uncharacterized protein YprB with RNaseH-like and TPR domain
MTTVTAPRISADRLRTALGTRDPKRASQPAPRRHAALEALYPGREIANEYGRCFVAEWTFPLQHPHGRQPLEQALLLNDRGAACIGRASEYKAPQHPAFLDTETTGLSGGTGTYAFLVGIGSIEGDAAIVRQYFMRDYDEEPALLEAVSQQLARHDAVITYNGKTFDLPLIETRFIASRRSPHVIPPSHLDLLFPTRRLLRGILERCTLVDVERSVLQHHRVGDLPGWMIPSVYFQFVREGDPRLIGGVLEHNREDILSLFALTGWLCRVYQSPTESRRDARLLTRVSKTYELLGWRDEAIRVLSHAVTGVSSDDSRAEAALELARLHRIMGAGEDAERMWHVAAEHPALGLEALIAWAKYLEHERRDFGKARDVVDRALVRIQLRYGPSPDVAIDGVRQALEHRLARIVRRQGR